MAWTAPKTWTAETLTSSDLNTHLRDNLLALKDPPTDDLLHTSGTNYATTSTSFVAIAAAELTLNVTTTGGDLLVLFNGRVTGGSSEIKYLSIALDGTNVSGANGLWYRTGETNYAASIAVLLTGVSAGARQIRLLGKTSAGSLTIEKATVAFSAREV